MFLEITDTPENYLKKALLILRRAVFANGYNYVRLAKQGEDFYIVEISGMRIGPDPSYLDYQLDYLRIIWKNTIKDICIPISISFYVEGFSIMAKISYDEHKYYVDVANYEVSKLLES